MITVGVDPGIHGGIAVADGAALLAVYKMPTFQRRMSRGADRDRVSADALAALLRQYVRPRTCVVVEHVAGRASDGGGSAYQFGEATGVVLGILAALGNQPHRVIADMWSRGVGLRPGCGKDGRIAHAKMIWPEQAHHFAGAHADGRADASLISLYGQRLLAR